MEEVVKIELIKNEIEAQLVDDSLAEKKIPHLMRSYHDSAFDGIFQEGVWGHVEAPNNYREQVLSIVMEIRSKK